jgi:hypothetical protein
MLDAGRDPSEILETQEFQALIPHDGWGQISALGRKERYDAATVAGRAVGDPRVGYRGAGRVRYAPARFGAGWTARSVVGLGWGATRRRLDVPCIRLGT